MKFIPLGVKILQHEIFTPVLWDKYIVTLNCHLLGWGNIITSSVSVQSFKDVEVIFVLLLAKNHRENILKRTIFVDLELKDQQNVKIACVYRSPWTDEEYIVDL